MSRVASKMDKTEQTVIIAAVMGAIIGIGQLLLSSDPLKPRAAVGRAIVSAGISVSAFTVLAWIPDAPAPLLVGVSALLASLGTSGLTLLAHRLVDRYVGPAKGKE